MFHLKKVKTLKMDCLGENTPDVKGRYLKQVKTLKIDPPAREYTIPT